MCESIKLAIPIKPFSVNKAWKGRRYRTNEYKQFERDVNYLLPIDLPKVPGGTLMVHYKWYMSNHKVSDNDNPTKPFQDILVSAGLFKNDCLIYRTLIDKIPCDEMEDSIEVEIRAFDYKEEGIYEVHYGCDKHENCLNMHC